MSIVNVFEDIRWAGEAEAASVSKDKEKEIKDIRGSLFVRVEVIDQDSKVTNLWYNLPGGSSEEEEEEDDKDEAVILHPSFKLVPPNSHLFSSQIAVGSFIYVLGGMDYSNNLGGVKFYKDVYILDTKNPDKGWEKGPNMISSRIKAYTFTLCGGYDNDNTPISVVLGGSFNQPYGEVLGSDIGTWKFLRTKVATPEYPLGFVNAHGVIFAGRRFDFRPHDPCNEYAGYEFCPDNCDPFPMYLFIPNQNALYRYSFIDFCWTIADKSFHLKPNSYSGVCVGDILYILKWYVPSESESELLAYSLKELKWYGTVSGFDTYPNALPRDSYLGSDYLPSQQQLIHIDDPTHRPCLVYLGKGILCMLWAETESSMNIRIHCTKFTVKFDDQNHLPAAHIKSYRTHKLFYGGGLRDCVLVST